MSTTADKRPPARRLNPVAPEPIGFHPIGRIWREWKAERRRDAAYPPGDLRPSPARTMAFARDPLPILLDSYEHWGPVFTLRMLSVPVVFMIGPEANHFMLVSDASKFSWRDGSMGDLVPLLGDGLLTTDGDYHRRARMMMLPSFHRERIARSGEVMIEEAEAAADALTARVGERFDLYEWTRSLALRVAMRALFGFDPDGREGSTGHDFETALKYYSYDYAIQMLRGPGTPFDRLTKASARLDVLIQREIEARRARGASEASNDGDLLGLLLDARDDDGRRLSDREIRDQAMTLLFAGHDTTTSTVTFLMYELARHPAELEALLAEQDAVLGTASGVRRQPSPAELTGDSLPQLEMAIEETLRKYPPAWIGPRRSLERFTFNGIDVPAGIPVNYSSWASHHLPDVWPEPEAFRPERFSTEARKAIPKGAYVPFGGGSRTCIGMRFGQMEIRAIATALLSRMRLESSAGRHPQIRQMPTLTPKGGMPMTIHPRGAAATVNAPVARD